MKRFLVALMVVLFCASPVLGSEIAQGNIVALFLYGEKQKIQVYNPTAEKHPIKVTFTLDGVETTFIWEVMQPEPVTAAEETVVEGVD